MTYEERVLFENSRHSIAIILSRYKSRCEKQPATCRFSLRARTHGAQRSLLSSFLPYGLFLEITFPFRHVNGATRSIEPWFGQPSVGKTKSGTFEFASTRKHETRSFLDLHVRDKIQSEREKDRQRERETDRQKGGTIRADYIENERSLSQRKRKQGLGEHSTSRGELLIKLDPLVELTTSNIFSHGLFNKNPSFY